MASADPTGGPDQHSQAAVRSVPKSSRHSDACGCLRVLSGYAVQNDCRLAQLYAFDSGHQFGPGRLHCACGQGDRIPLWAEGGRRILRHEGDAGGPWGQLERSCNRPL
uniref:(northern house mosquito) hypothetical protein n=1 Tax=Culex pipiens TaxID=7175 RepID=A0A8D8ALK7_CULPI